VIRVGSRASGGRGLRRLRGGSLIDLLSLGLRARIGGGTYDCARCGAENDACTGVSRTGDEASEDGAPDGADGGTSSRGRRRLHHDPLIRRGVGSARVYARLLNGPDVALIAVTIRLFRRLTVIRIDKDFLRRRRRRRRHHHRARWGRRNTRSKSNAGGEHRAAAQHPLGLSRNVKQCHELTSLQSFPYQRTNRQ
jgi:hypothetical protein